MVNTVELTEDGAVRSHADGPAVDPMLGRRLLHYRVVERIGQLLPDRGVTTLT